MKIVVIGTALDEAHRDMILKAAGGEKVCFLSSEKEMTAETADADVIYGHALHTARTSRHLKWLCVPSAGVEPFLRPGSFANENCLLTNGAGAYGVSIAEHIIAVSLMMMRGLTVHYAASLKGEWAPRRPQRSLKGCRITALGTGDIGRTFALRARSFEPAALVGVSRSGRPDPAFDRVLPVKALDSVLPETDLLVISLPATPETEGLLSRERIFLLPRGAYLVNVGRGSAVDDDALRDSLEEERLAGAALDVFRTEPLPDSSPLWHTKNLLITPHVAGNMTLRHTIDRNTEMFCEDLENYRAGRPLRHLVDRALGY